MPETPQYTVEYRNVKHPRCEFKTGSLLIILPKKGWTPQQVLEKYEQWIKRKQATINAAIEQTNKTALVKNRTDKELRRIVQRYAETAQSDLHTKINKIFIRKMNTKWASHSQNNNLTVNTLLKFLPEDLISYIIYHETAHAIERKHNQKFWNIITKKFPDYPSKEKDLLTYWFTIQKTINSGEVATR
ncbi:MAG: M48 family metallopeptidase [Candidatus Bathyarchaeia archaeon]